MFDIGFQELVVIFVIALLVFGPEKLPEVGRTLGKWMIEIRRGIQNAKVQMETEFEETQRRAETPVDAESKTEKPEGQDGVSPGEKGEG
jgi:Tat protein translocase TatB subunit